MDTVQKEEMLSVAPSGAPEEPLIEQGVWGAVRSLRERGLSKNQIGRELDLDIKTVRKWLRQKWEPQRRPGRSRALDRWEDLLRGRSPEQVDDPAVPILPDADEREGGERVQYVKRNALAGRRFRDLEELWLLEWCIAVADQRVHGTTHELPAQRFARAEATALLAVDRRLRSGWRAGSCRVMVWWRWRPTATRCR